MITVALFAIIPACLMAEKNCFHASDSHTVNHRGGFKIFQQFELFSLNLRLILR